MKYLITYMLFLLSIAQAYGQGGPYYYDTYQHSSLNDSYNEQMFFSTKSCQEYKITIQGTFRIHIVSNFHPACTNAGSASTAEPNPMFPIGNQLGKVAMDPEYFFANYAAGCDNNSRIRDRRFEYTTDGGNTWALLPQPINSAYNLNHSYEYLITGNGGFFGLRQTSTENGDDVGELKVTVEHLPKPCENMDLEIVSNAVQGSCTPNIEPVWSDCAYRIIGANYNWGDGTSSMGLNLDHNYTSPGLYNISIRYWATNGVECCSFTRDILHEVASQDCSPCNQLGQNQFTANALYNYLGHFIRTGQVQLTDDHVVVWDFGDGQYHVGNERMVTHPYLTAGYYTVKMKIFYLDESNNTCCNHEYEQEIFSYGFPLAQGIQPTTENDGDEAQEQRGAASETLHSIDRVKAESTFQVFPNPADQLVSIKTDISIKTISIINMSGQIISKVSNIQPERDIYTLDVSDLEKGSYLLSLISDTGERHIKQLLIE
ncbi:PKD domain-containing protein [bacterium SCSIO 12741]|nr:PKD domain-containing protein [bacterium SCSIO 12741]